MKDLLLRISAAVLAAAVAVIAAAALIVALRPPAPKPTVNTCESIVSGKLTSAASGGSVECSGTNAWANPASRQAISR